MHLRLSLTGILATALLALPLAYASADDDRGRSENRRNDDRKSATTSGIMTTSITSLQEQIKSLQAMIENLKKQRRDDDTSKSERRELNEDIKEAKEDMNAAQKQLKFVRSLSRGMSGDDVRDLQELLAEDPEIFSRENVTGYFGPMTFAALQKFQRKHGIEAIGIFGPKTQAKLLALFEGKVLPPGIAKKLGLSYGTSTPGTGLVTVCHKTGSGSQTLVIAVPALSAHLGHGDTLGVCAEGGSGTTTPPTDIVKPLITNIALSNISTSSVSIFWNTNENATGRVYYSTTFPVDPNTASSVGTSTLTTGHSLALSGLNPSTTYYLLVESKDAANNTSTSSIQFNTSALADTTAPMISNTSISGISSTTATMSWTTNENATGAVYYATTTPLNFSSAATMGTTTLSTNHSFSLTGLMPNTTYYYAFASRDGANNAATTSQSQFTTPSN